MGTPLHQKLMVNLPHPSQRSQVGDSKQQPQALTVRTTTTTPRHIHPPKINQGGRSRQTLGPASDDTPLQQGVKLIPRPGTFSKVWTTVGKPNHKHNIIVLRSGGTQHNTIANHKLHQCISNKNSQILPSITSTPIHHSAVDITRNLIFISLWN